MIFDKLVNLNVNEYTEKRVSGSDRNGRELQLTYLSWVYAVKKMTEVCPDWSYEIVRFNGLPYAFDPMTGYMVTTRVTADGQTKEMWLPVMDSANHAMKSEPYTIKTRYGKEIPVQAATMFDINKALMRCLTKNLAMFGLGLYIYAGEDLPEEQKPEPKPAEEPKPVEDRINAEDGSPELVNARSKVLQIAELKSVTPSELVAEKSVTMFGVAFTKLNINQLRLMFAELKGMQDV